MIHGFREESLMNRDQFWLTDTQFLKIAPHIDKGDGDTTEVNFHR
jgi:hypothetical protein